MNNKIGGIAAIASAVIGVILMLKVWAFVGLIVYGIAFGVSLYKLNQNVAYNDSFNIIVFLKRINKKTFWQEGAYVVVVASVPVVVCIFLYSWIILDTVRSAALITDAIF